MKIALLGYGKMGKEIEKQALAKGHEVVLRVDVGNASEASPGSLQKADVAIEFSTPASAVSNIRKCFDASVPVVVGTTGWLDQFEAIRKECMDRQQALFYASNYSIGVNIFFHINRVLARIMAGYPEYGIGVEEIHHTQKLDAPSGTALSIAHDILAAVPRKEKWTCHIEGKEKAPAPSENELHITAVREENVPGTHTVTYDSPVDRIDIIHTAHSRHGFAAGALAASEWIAGKKGVFGMNDMLKF